MKTLSVLLLGLLCQTVWAQDTVPLPPSIPAKQTNATSTLHIIRNVVVPQPAPKQVQVSWTYGWPVYGYDLLSGSTPNLGSMTKLLSTQTNQVVVPAAGIGLSFFRVLAYPQTNSTTLVTWGAVTNTYYYCLYYGPGSRTYTNMVPVTNTTSYLFTNLPYNGKFFFSVTSVNLNGVESDYSEEYAYKTPTWDTNLIAPPKVSVKLVP